MEYVPDFDKVTLLGNPIRLDEAAPEVGTGSEYCWTPTSTNGTWLDFSLDPEIPSFDTLPPGDYESSQPLNNLIGCELNGIWELEIEDRQFEDNGVLFSWGVEFDPSTFPVIEQFSPMITGFGWQTNNAVIIDQTDSTLITEVNTSGDTRSIFTIQDEYGCAFDTSFTSTVLPPTHPDCNDCLDDLISQIDTSICEGAPIMIDARPTAIPEDIILSFQESPARSFSKSPVQDGQVFRSILDVNNVLPSVITNPDTEIESVCLNATIDASSPYSITLVSPQGQRLILVEEGTIGQFQNACFRPTATESINGAIPPFNSNAGYLPSSPFSVLTLPMATNTNGEWRLEIASTAGPITAGALGGWNISFNGAPNYIYTWTPTEGLSCDDCSTPLAEPTETTTYRVEVSNDFGCVYTDSIEIIIDPQASDMVVDRIEVSDVLCFGDNTGELEAFVSGGSGDYTYLWNDANAANQQKAVLLPTGVFTVEVRDAIEGCVVRDSAMISQPDSLIVNLNPTDVLCRGDATGSIEALVSGGSGPYSYSWTSGDIDSIAINLFAGTYSTIVTDANNCTATSESIINEPADALVVSIQQTDQGCFGAADNELTGIASGGTGTNYLFSWSNGASTATISNLDSIEFTLTVTDEGGCARTITQKAQDLLPIDFNFLHTKPTCPGIDDGQIGVDNIVGGAGMIPTDYIVSWSTSETGSVIRNLAGDQTYSATVTDQRGCSSEGAFALENPTAITFDLQVDSTSCFEASDGSAFVSNPQGPGVGRTYSFQWSDPSGSTNASINNLVAGDYIVTVSDDLGCESERAFMIGQPNPINANITTEDNGCFGESLGAIALQPTGGNGGFSFQWSTGAQTANLNTLPAGDYQVTITDRKNCTLETSAPILEPTPVTISLETIDPSCFEAEDGAISLITALGGTTPYSYSIDNQNFNPSNNIFGLGNGSYTVFIKDANDCVYTAETQLVHPAPLVLTPDQPEYRILLGDSTQLGVTAANNQGFVTFNWSAPYDGTLSCQDCSDPISDPFNTITYQIKWNR